MSTQTETLTRQSETARIERELAAIAERRNVGQALTRDGKDERELQRLTADRDPDAAPPAPIILVTTSQPSLLQHPGNDGESVHPRLGRLVQPRHYSSIAKTAELGIPWAADNDCFQGLDAPAFVKMIDALQGLPGCLFVTVPDVVGDSAATLARFNEWAPDLERRGLPAALVAQDGLDVAEVPWHRIAALFIGGTNDYKLGPDAREVAREAHRRGVWVHWGRVNTRKRYDLIRATGAADSFDGSKWARWRKTYLPTALTWLDESAAERRDAIERPTTERTAAMTPTTDPTPERELSLGERLDRRDRREAAAIAEARRQIAELGVLDEYDDARILAGHDYGAGQRAAELIRRRRDVEAALRLVHGAGALDALERIYRHGDVARDELTADELQAAIDAILAPRIARIEREDYRRSTPATKRTTEALRTTRRRLEAHVAGRRAERA